VERRPCRHWSPRGRRHPPRLRFLETSQAPPRPRRRHCPCTSTWMRRRRPPLLAPCTLLPVRSPCAASAPKRRRRGCGGRRREGLGGEEGTFQLGRPLRRRAPACGDGVGGKALERRRGIYAGEDESGVKEGAGRQLHFDHHQTRLTTRDWWNLRFRQYSDTMHGNT